MLEKIKQFKTEYLAQLEHAKSEIERTESTLVEQKYVYLKQEVDKKVLELDKAYSEWVAERTRLYNEEVANKKQEVDKKKTEIDAIARSKASAEAHYEIVAQISEYDTEISNLKKELN